MNSTATLEAVRLDDEHRYWLGDIELHGCTSTLKSVGLIDTRHYSEEARLRGTLVHDTIQADLEHDLVEETVDPALAGYLAAARAYLRDAQVQVLAVERPLADAGRFIAGKPDVVGIRAGRCVLVDWKTGSYEAWHRFQSAWYEHLARVNGLVTGLVDRVGVYLAADGSYRTQSFKDRIDWQVAQSAITVVHAKRLS